MTSWGPHNPHPLSQMRAELVWDGKYDEYGNRRTLDVAGLALPLQRIETIDEPQSRTQAQGTIFDERKAHRDDFRNRLIWGENKLVMASLMEEFKGRIDLIYIDPPFDIGADFTMNIPIGQNADKISKSQSIIEMVAFRDMWGKGIDSYSQMVYERVLLMKDLLSEKGSIYVHVDATVGHIVRSIMDDVFGQDNFVRQIIWRIGWISGYKSKAKNWIRNHDMILYYRKSKQFIFNKQYIPYPADYVRRDGNRPTGSGYPVEDTWNCSDIDKLDSIQIKSFSNEKTGFVTQKNENLLERIIRSSSDEDSIVADFFCGSGTLGAVAERMGRRWVMADLGRFSIHTSRKRLINSQRELHEIGQTYRSFDVHNLGRYERQWWQRDALKGADADHRDVVLKFFRAEALHYAPSPLLHGRKGNAFVHVDGIDGIFTRTEASAVCKAVQAAGGTEVHCLAWDFEMEIRQAIEPIQEWLSVRMRLHRIPREIMERNRTETPPFYEIAHLTVEPVLHADGGVDVRLTDFLPSLTEVRSKELEEWQQHASKSGFDFIDFWAVDFDWAPDRPFNHHWQDYRTRKDRGLKTESDAAFCYTAPGKHKACIKVVDVFGCDTSISLEIET